MMVIMMEKILVIGCGGIGSWLAHFLYFGRRNSLFYSDITLADDDIVEPKNLLYANFLPEDIGKNKAEALAKRYFFKVIKHRINSEYMIKKFDLIIIATDNGKSRKMVYNSGKMWIDLRSKGGAYAVFSSKGDKISKMLKTIDTKVKRDSCQYEIDIKTRKIEAGNIIAASIGYQMILKLMRGDKTNNIIGMA